MRGCRYVGYALTTQWEGVEAKSQQVIGFDMGGTSTDVSRFAGSYEHVFESVTAGTALATSLTAFARRFVAHGTFTSARDAGVTIQAPQLDINTVAAGGGSRLYFRTGVFQVHQGPDSAMRLQVVLSARGFISGHVCCRWDRSLLAPTQGQCATGSQAACSP